MNRINHSFIAQSTRQVGPRDKEHGVFFKKKVTK